MHESAPTPPYHRANPYQAVFSRAIGSNFSLISGIIVAFVSCYPFIFNDNSTLHTPFDLSVYYGAIKHWIQTGSIYDWALPPQRIYGFTYPPFAAIFFSPLALFPSVTSLAPIFLLANVAAMVATTVLCLQNLKVQNRTAWGSALWLSPLLLLTFPIRQNMWMGQINMFLLLLILIDTLLLTGTRYSGILTGIAASIKMTPAIFGLYFIIKKDWGALLRFIATGAVAIGLSLMIDPKITFEFFTDKIFEANRVGSIVEPLSFNILSETSRLLHQPINSILYAVLALALALVTVRSTRQLQQAGQNLYAIIVMGFFMLMISPISWNHHWVWALPAVLICAISGYRSADTTMVFLAVSGAVLFTQRFEAWFSGNHWELGQWPLYTVAMHMLPALWSVAFMSLPIVRQVKQRNRLSAAPRTVDSL